MSSSTSSPSPSVPPPSEDSSNKSLKKNTNDDNNNNNNDSSISSIKCSSISNEFSSLEERLSLGPPVRPQSPMDATREWVINTDISNDDDDDDIYDLYNKHHSRTVSTTTPSSSSLSSSSQSQHQQRSNTHGGTGSGSVGGGGGGGGGHHGPQGLIAMDSLRHASRVSRRAALATKEQFWDSNDAAVVVSQRAVDQWEQGYNALRGLLKALGHSAQGLYGAAKAGAGGIEHGLLVPVRDWILLPAFGGVEHVVGETVTFLQSDQTQVVAKQSLDLAKQVPWVGETVLVPSLVLTAQVIKTTWNIAQYPIPSPEKVRESVDTVLGGTKWALSTAGNEIFLYVKRADANITRSLSHTQWKVLGSGPYHTLDKLNKREVIDHLCERYFATPDPVSRYELAAHIRAHNRPLYHDLVLTGLLRDRGGMLTVDDEWLSPRPQYRYTVGSNCFLLDDNKSKGQEGDTVETETEAFPLWFRLPYVNGQRPKRDTPWICFGNDEREQLEMKYLSVLQQTEEESQHHDRDDDTDDDNNDLVGVPNPQHQDRPSSSTWWDPPKYPTNAKWLFPDLDDDLLLDEKRHAVSFFPCCPKCRRRHDNISYSTKQLGELCEECAAQHLDAPWVDALLSPPPLEGVYRPTMWRYYGPGDELRRATWFLDTQRNGPQPYGEDAQAVLEDAYLFLRWISQTRSLDGTSTLLTVQVPSPDGSENQLVQFSSLTSATAIGKGLGSAISIFKRRVYRGAYFAKSNDGNNETAPPSPVRQGADLGQEEKEEATTNNADDFDPHRHVEPSDTSDNAPSKNTLTLDDKNLDHHDKDRKNHPSTPPPSPPPLSLRRKHKGPPLALELKRSISSTAKKRRASTPNRTSENGISNSRTDENEVDHLVLVVHGIGEMMQSFDFFGLKKVPTIVECCGFLRDNHAEVLDVRFAQVYQAIDGMPETRFGRVEYLPVEWHESFSIHSTRRQTEADTPNGRSRPNCSINDISLRTIPTMRQFANDTLMDVLYFMNPEHHGKIIDIVVSEMNYVVNRFRKLTGFTGTVSIVGHSLGSIIAWDILDHQRVNRPEAPMPQPESTLPEVEERRQIENAFPQLDFLVDNAFMLGSPIPVFLMIRNQDAPLSVDYTLQGCPRVFNIFHPFDPVSYRIEPLLNPSNADIEPKIMTHWNGGYRFQYQTKRLWEKLVDQTLSAQESVVQVLESGIAALGLLDSAYDDGEEDGGGAGAATGTSLVSSSSSSTAAAASYSVVTTGRLNGGRRIDYMLQEKELDRANEYVAAFAAHSCYWLEKDLSLFIARQICLVALERASGEAEDSMVGS
jgi:DDHD domain